MKMILSVVMSTLLVTGWAASSPEGGSDWQKSGDHYSKDCGDFTTFQFDSTEGVLAGYILSVTPPTSWLFIPAETKASAGTLTVSAQNRDQTATSGVRRLTLESPGKSSASATAFISANISPVSFTLTLSGKLTRSGDVAGTAPTWSAQAGTDFYYIKSNMNGTPNIIVPFGADIHYMSYKNSVRCSSDWIVRRLGGSEGNREKKGISVIEFYRSEWNPWMWGRNYSTPRCGDYFISASPAGKTVPAADGWMRVIDAQFEHAGTPGWDDYSNWSGEDYYSNRTSSGETVNFNEGRCTEVHIAVKANTSGSVNVVQSHDADITISGTGAENITTQKNGLTTAVSFQGGNSLSTGTINVSLGGTHLCSGKVHAYKETSGNLLVVQVLSGTTTTPPPLPNWAAATQINQIFAQVMHTIEVTTQPLEYSGVSEDTIWRAIDRADLVTYFTANGGVDIDDYKHVLFILPGRDSENQNIYGWGARPGKFSWIYSFVPCPNIIVHELCHNYNLPDQYNSTDFSPGSDSYNLMNLCLDICAQQTQLRLGQWNSLAGNMGK